MKCKYWIKGNLCLKTKKYEHCPSNVDEECNMVKKRKIGVGAKDCVHGKRMAIYFGNKIMHVSYKEAGKIAFDICKLVLL